MIPVNSDGPAGKLKRMPAWMTPLTALLVVAFVAAELFISSRRRSCVRGSRERYVWSTVWRIHAWAFVAALTWISVDMLTTGYVFGGAINGALLGVRFWWAVKFVDTNIDDDWFTGRGRKIRKAIRRAISNRRATTATNAA